MFQRYQISFKTCCETQLLRSRLLKSPTPKQQKSAIQIGFYTGEKSITYWPPSLAEAI
jgi:hypothetical protein